MSQPPPLFPEGGAPQYQPPQYPSPPKSGRLSGMIIVAMVFGIIAAVVLAVIIVLGVLGSQAERDDAGAVIKDGKVTVQNLKPGDCFNNVPAENKEIMAVDAIPCAQPHDAQVLVNVTVSASTYPGIEAVGEQIEALCVEKVGDRLDRSTLSARLDLFYLSPTAESWQAGDRGGTCIATANDNQKLTAPVG